MANQKITPDEALDLASRYRDAAAGMSDYLNDNWATIASKDRDELSRLKDELLNFSRDLVTTAAGVILDDAKASVAQLGAATQKANDALAEINEVKNAIAIATSLIGLAAAITTGNPASIFSAMKGALAAVKKTEPDFKGGKDGDFGKDVATEKTAGGAATATKPVQIADAVGRNTNHEEVINAANREWEHWGSHTLDLRPGAAKRPKIRKEDTDKNLTRAQYILDNYCPAANSQTITAKIMKDAYAWSGVTISYFFKSALFARWDEASGEGFPFSAGHRKWIKLAVRAARGEAAFMYRAHPIEDALATPKVGDLVAYARHDTLTDAQKEAKFKPPELTFDLAKAWFDRVGKDDDYNSHSDLVVAVSDTVIEVIGGNVEQTVAKKIIPLDAQGRIGDRSKPWFAVLRRQEF